MRKRFWEYLKSTSLNIYDNIKEVDCDKLEIGSHVDDDIEVEGPLGHSNFSVYKVFSRSKSKEFALKTFVSPHATTTPNFRRESSTEGLSHPNIITVITSRAHHIYEDHKKHKHMNLAYVLMDLAPYGDFRSLIEHDGIPHVDKLIRTYFKQLIEGIEYLHSQGIAHMDLKTQNLLVGEDFKLKIADFDICQSVDDHNLIGGGTEDYRAPEVIAGVTENPKEADIYSAGIILFELKYGFVPYSEDASYTGDMLFYYMLSEQDKFWKITEAKIKSKVDPDFKAMFSSMVITNPKDRATLIDVKNNVWYNGPTCSEEELFEIMSHFFLQENMKKSCSVPEQEEKLEI